MIREHAVGAAYLHIVYPIPVKHLFRHLCACEAARVRHLGILAELAFQNLLDGETDQHHSNDYYPNVHFVFYFTAL